MFPEQREIVLPQYDGQEPLHAFVAATTAVLRHEYGEEWTIVAEGEAARALPDIAFALRAQHRRVIGYRITDGILPPPGLEWPDAHVTYVLTRKTEVLLAQATQARLRGFEVIEQTAAGSA